MCIFKIWKFNILNSFVINVLFYFSYKQIIMPTDLIAKLPPIGKENTSSFSFPCLDHEMDFGNYLSAAIIAYKINNN